MVENVAGEPERLLGGSGCAGRDGAGEAEWESLTTTQWEAQQGALFHPLGRYCSFNFSQLSNAIALPLH